MDFRLNSCYEGRISKMTEGRRRTYLKIGRRGRRREQWVGTAWVDEVRVEVCTVREMITTDTNIQSFDLTNIDVLFSNQL